ncbi:PEP-CTERM sorting domain-containing protein [Verrucomicrobium sp. GAS474]|uniref:beta strand repeat-containing protein n=1 Tax=Verrucomicrobium sp. GAS474 TaxID=1882831 RepID=UPI0012FFC8FF|nr:PEP-CTERM sorting domain-containing protein [Verrucomicrobium sp. GAS474]
MGVNSEAANTVISWQGLGSGVGTSASWDSAANWSAPGSFNSTTTNLDFSNITTATTLSATGAGTISVGAIAFGGAASPTSAPNITLNGDGTAGDTIITLGTLSASTYVYVGTLGSTTSNSPVDTLGSDLTLNLGTNFTGYRYFGNYAANTAVTGTLAGRSVLLINSKIIGNSTGTNGQLIFNSYSAYGTGTGSYGNAATVLTNNANSFDAPMTQSGLLSYTSIGNIGGGPSALGSPSLASNGVLNFSNGAGFTYIGSATQTSNRDIKWGGSIGIQNAATTASVLTFTGNITNTATGSSPSTQTLRLGATSGNTLSMNGVIGDSATAGYLTKVVKDAGSTVITTYYDSTGTLKTSTNTGTVILRGANTYTGGTLVSAGSLLVANTTGSGLGTGAVSVASGGTLGGNGIIATTGATAATNVVVASGGIVSPGGVDGVAIDTLKFDAAGANTASSGVALLTMQTGSKFAFDLGASNTSDKIVIFDYVVGNLALNANAFTFSGAQAGSYVLFQTYSDALGNTLTATGLTAANFSLAGSTGLTGYTATLDFSTTGEVILNLAAVPEPSTWALLLGGGAVLLLPLARRRLQACKA